MRIEHWTHERVMPDGVCIDELGKPNGAVGVEPAVKISSDNGGCGLENCHCSDGHWLMINYGRNEKDETVSGVTVWFDNWGEMALLLSTRALAG